MEEKELHCYNIFLFFLTKSTLSLESGAAALHIYILLATSKGWFL